MIFPYQPEPDQKNKLVTHSNVSEIDFTLFNSGSQYLMSAGPNMVVFNKEHKDVLGHDLSEAELPAAIEQFIEDSITRTLRGRYIHRITFWKGRSWYFHSHPIYAESKGDPVGVLMITEPHDKPIEMQTAASFVVGGPTPSASIPQSDNSVAIASSAIPPED
jgi:hypothetical protein